MYIYTHGCVYYLFKNKTDWPVMNKKKIPEKGKKKNHATKVNKTCKTLTSITVQFLCPCIFSNGPTQDHGEERKKKYCGSKK